MQIADLVDFIAGEEPDFQRPNAEIRPGDKFGRYEPRSGWTYVEVKGLNDGQLREGCVYARAFSRHYPTGREGYCYLSQLGLRIDEDTWTTLRENGWPGLGAALELAAADMAPTRLLHS